MRILHIFDHSVPLHSGYTFRSQEIIRGERRQGWETFHLTGPKHAKYAGVKEGKERVSDLDFYRTGPVLGISSRVPVLRQWAVIDALEQRIDELLLEIKPDIIHAHSPALNGVAAIMAARHSGLPVVYEVRAFWEDAAVDHGTSRSWGPRYRATRALESWVLKRATHVTTICEGLRCDIVGRGVPSKKVSVIPNAVGPEMFLERKGHGKALIRELGLDGRIVLGFIGSFYAYEGLDVLLKALSQIKHEIPMITVLLVGGGPEEAHLKSLVNKLEISKNVIFTGRVPHEKVTQYYQVVDAFIYPRLSMRLTDLVTPLKPLEAMAQRRVVIASDVGGHRELIKEGITGYLFPSGSVDGLAQRLRDVIAERGTWSQMIERARCYVEEERSWDAVVNRLDSVYQVALGAGS